MVLKGLLRFSAMAKKEGKRREKAGKRQEGRPKPDKGLPPSTRLPPGNFGLAASAQLKIGLAPYLFREETQREAGKGKKGSEEKREERRAKGKRKAF
jgi:hypothetical protein